MLGNQPFYHSLIKKYVVLFGSTFNNIYVERTLPADAPKIDKILRVPISYEAKDKLLARFIDDPDIQRPYSLLMPRMSFDLKGMFYDGTRKMTTPTRLGRRNPVNPDAMMHVYSPVPYNFNFELNIAVKNVEDGTKIIEQILPFFEPDYTSTVHLIPEMNIVQDIPIIYQGIQKEDSFDGEYKNRRHLTWTINFLMKGYLYGPVTQPKIIKFVSVPFHNASKFDTAADAVGIKGPDEEVQTQVTLTANGQPTNDHTQSIPFQNIDIDSDWGTSSWIVDITTS